MISVGFAPAINADQAGIVVPAGQRGALGADRTDDPDMPEQWLAVRYERYLRLSQACRAGGGHFQSPADSCRASTIGLTVSTSPGEGEWNFFRKDFSKKLCLFAVNVYLKHNFSRLALRICLATRNSSVTTIPRLPSKPQKALKPANYCHFSQTQKNGIMLYHAKFI